MWIKLYIAAIYVLRIATPVLSRHKLSGSALEEKGGKPTQPMWDFSFKTHPKVSDCLVYAEVVCSYHLLTQQIAFRHWCPQSHDQLLVAFADALVHTL